MKTLLYIVILTFVTIAHAQGFDILLKASRQQYVNETVANPIPQSGLLVDLNAETMFTTGDVLATEGQPITNWSNGVSGSAIAGAVQLSSTLQPILQLESGVKAVKFDGSNDFLTFDNAGSSLLHWDKSESHSIIVLTGNTVTSGRLIHRGFSNYAGEYSFLYSGGTNYLVFLYSTDSPDQFSTPASLPVDKTFMAINYRGNDTTADIWLNNTKVHDNVLVTGNHDSTSHPTLIAARTNTTPTSYGNYYGGSIRRILIYDRALTDTEILSIYSTL